MKTLYLILRLILGLVFIASSLLKQMYINNFIINIKSYQIVPVSITQPIAIIICVLELLIGIMIFFNIYGKIAVRITILLMVGFILFVFWSFINNKDWTCNCFGSIFSEKISYLTLARNITILFISIIVYIRFNEKFSFDSVKYKVVIISLIVLLSLTPIIYHKLFPEQSSITIGDVISVDLVSWENIKIDLYNRKEPYAILFVFSLDDCSSCISEGIFWNKIDSMFNSNLKPIAIIHSNNIYAIKAYVKYKNIQFPVVWDKYKNIISRLNYKTPFKILIDQRNRVVNISQMYGSESTFKKYVAKVKKIINLSH